MIDIHTHLLNNVDNGSVDIIETLTSLKLAEEAGFTDIILTPHYIEGYYENNYASIKHKIEELKQKLEDNSIKLNIHQGNEIYISKNIVDLIKSHTVSSLAGSKYVLVEYPQKVKLVDLEKILENLKEVGYTPVLAHPERYVFIQKNLRTVNTLISHGILMQANYGSILGQYGKEAQRTLIKMLKNNMVHVLATDTHRTGFVYGHFYKVEKEFLKYISRDKFEELTVTVPRNIIENKTIEVEQTKNNRKRLHFAFA
ncbi:MAG: hypothetical protein IKD76_01670 [Clostridia bacterium]|nr:hypothetical protein [Clostridia bacterium]